MYEGKTWNVPLVRISEDCSAFKKQISFINKAVILTQKRGTKTRTFSFRTEDFFLKGLNTHYLRERVIIQLLSLYLFNNMYKQYNMIILLLSKTYLKIFLSKAILALVSYISWLLNERCKWRQSIVDIAICSYQLSISREFETNSLVYKLFRYWTGWLSHANIWL